MADKLTNEDLAKIADDPQAALNDHVLRGKVLGMPVSEFKLKLKDYALTNDLDPASMVKEIIKEIDI